MAGSKTYPKDGLQLNFTNDVEKVYFTTRSVSFGTNNFIWIRGFGEIKRFANVGAHGNLSYKRALDYVSYYVNEILTR